MHTSTIKEKKKEEKNQDFLFLVEKMSYDNF